MLAPELVMLLIGTAVLWVAGFIIAPVVAALGRYQLAVTLVALLIAIPLSFTGLAVAIAQPSPLPGAHAAAIGLSAGITFSVTLAFAALALSSASSLAHHSPYHGDGEA